MDPTISKFPSWILSRNIHKEPSSFLLANGSYYWSLPQFRWGSTLSKTENKKGRIHTTFCIAHLCRIRSVYYIVMSRGTMQFPPQYTSGFGLGGASKCRLCWRHSGQKAEFCVVKVAPLSVWYYLIVFLIGFLILFCYLLNCITWLTLLPFSIPCQFLVSVCQSKSLFKVNSDFFKAESKVCLVK